MKGRIKAGEGSLIGNAGEYYVMAELLKRGIIAALAPRNAPAFDILATNGTRSVKIRVKTKSQEYSDWQWMAKVDNETIFRDLSKNDDFTILVNLAMETKDLKYYVVPTYKIDKFLKAGFKKWKNTPGKHGQPHDPNNKKRNLSEGKYAPKLKDYLNGWEILWE